MALLYFAGFTLAVICVPIGFMVAVWIYQRMWQSE